MEYKVQSVGEQVFGAAAELFGLLSTPCRVRILCELCKSERNVGELLALVGGSQPNMSHHLNALYRGGVVQRRREGAKVFYQLVPGKVDLLCDALRQQRQAACLDQGGQP